jgi:hypothetical protein
MSSEIIFRDAASPADPDANLLLRFENTISTPLVDVEWLGDGEAISDVYTVAATSGSTVNVTADDPKNEVIGTGIAVTADASTWNYGVVPGCRIQFSSSLANGWTGKISMGALMAPDGSTSDRFNVGVIQSDTISTQRRIVAVNVGSEDSAGTEVYALPGLYIEDEAQPHVVVIQNHTDPARHASAVPGDFDITFADFQGGSPDTADVLVDGTKTIEDAKLDGAELYQHGAGNGYIDGADKFLGLGIIFADGGDPTSKTLSFFVREGHAWVEFAPDSSGSPGAWQSGPLTLTELGETTGTITASGTCYFWVRVNVPDSATPGDRKLYNLRARGLTI